MARQIIKSLLEDEEQALVVKYLTLLRVPHFSIPNGSSRNIREAVKLKRTGVSAGIPDLCIPVARKSYHALFIEMKRRSGGSLSPFQRNWHFVLRNEGYKVEVCKGFDAAKKVIDDYFMDEGGCYVARNTPEVENALA